MAAASRSTSPTSVALVVEAEAETTTHTVEATEASLWALRMAVPQPADMVLRAAILRATARTRDTTRAGTVLRPADTPRVVIPPPPLAGTVKAGTVARLRNQATRPREDIMAATKRLSLSGLLTEHYLSLSQRPCSPFPSLFFHSSCRLLATSLSIDLPLPPFPIDEPTHPPVASLLCPVPHPHTYLLAHVVFSTFHLVSSVMNRLVLVF